MADLATLNVVIAAKIDEFEAAMAEVEKGIGRAGKAAQAAGATLTQYVTLPLGVLAAASLKAAGDIQALEKGFAATYKGSIPLQEALGKVRELAKLPGLGLKEALQGATNLQAAGLSAELAQRSLAAFGNALATVGRGKADLDGVGLALGQIAAKGKISAEEINQLAERVPQIREAMKAAFGTADTEALNKAGIDATTFVEGVVTQLEKLPKVTGGLNNAFENLGDGVTIALAKVGDSLNKTFDIEGKINALGDVVSSLATKFSELSPATQQVIFGLAGAVAAAGPLLLVVGGIGAALPAVTAGFAVLGVTSVAALGPVAIAAAAVAAAAYLVYSNWEDVVGYFDGEGGRVFSDFADAVSSAVDTIVTSFARLNGVSGESALTVQELGAALRFMIREVVDGTTGILDFTNGIIRLITALGNGEWSAALSGAGQAVDGLSRPIRSLLGLLDEVKPPQGDGISPYFQSMTLNAFAAAGAVREVTAALSEQGKGVGLLADLEAKLKDARAKQTAATTEKDIAATNQLIDSLEKQIKRLKELGVASDEAQKALVKLREALSAPGKENQALGGGVDVLGEKIKVLSAGIPNLIAAGFAPNGKVVQSFVAQLNQLEGEYDKFKARIAEKQGMDGLLGEGKIDPNAFTLDLPDKIILPGFDYSAVQESVDQATAIYQSLTPAQRAAIESQALFNTEMEELLDSIGSRFEAVGEIIGSAFGSAITGMSSAGDAMRAALGGVIGVLADFMKDYGKKLLIIGSGSIALGNVGQGIAQIAAGTAIIAAAGIGSALGSAVARPSGNTGSAVPGSIPRTSTAATAKLPTQTVRVEVILGLREDAPKLLRGILDLDAYRARRLS